jgi:GGDEF domain-containing protein
MDTPASTEVKAEKPAVERAEAPEPRPAHADRTPRLAFEMPAVPETPPAFAMPPVEAPVAAETIPVASTPVAAAPPVALPEPTAAPAAAAEPASEAPPVPALALPPGFHDRSTLSHLMQNSDHLSGVVVAVGINDFQRTAEQLGRNGAQDLSRTLESQFRALLRDQDFACRSSEDEYILIYPQENGAAAQRRLNFISERLWDYQLRSLAGIPVMFSWGAVEVQGETLADAVASASERMYQTKRNRKTVTLDPQRGGRKKVVNQ